MSGSSSRRLSSSICACSANVRCAAHPFCCKYYENGYHVRNLDEQAYKALRARAVLDGRTVGEVISEAIRSYLGRALIQPGRSSLRAPFLCRPLHRHDGMNFMPWKTSHQFLGYVFIQEDFQSRA
jgi:hypothetical protein